MVFGKKSGGVFKLETVAKMNRGKVKEDNRKWKGAGSMPGQGQMTEP